MGPEESFNCLLVLTLNARTSIKSLPGGLIGQRLPENTEQFQSATELSSPVNIPDPIRIRSRLAGKHWPEAGRMIPAHWLASGPDPFGQNLTLSARTKSDLG